MRKSVSVNSLQQVNKRAMRQEGAYRGVIAFDAYDGHDRLEAAAAAAMPYPHHVPMLRRVLHPNVRHHRQRYDWDCGLACVQMVLPEDKSMKLQREFNSVCKAEGFAKSTWTIDLCYVLRRFDHPHSFYTLTLGAHIGYKCASFYSRVFNKDEARVNQRFDNARSSGIEVKCESLPLTKILECLQNGPAIALTDSTKLACNMCKKNRLSSELRKCLPIPVPTPAYVGHYIVLCGYDLAKRTVYYRNPACHDHYCAMSLGTFEESRCAFGTDEDIIFVENSPVNRKSLKLKEAP